MIKLTYEQKQYEYMNIGAQPYDMKVQMELKQDATLEEAIAMYINFLRIATYRVSEEKVMEAVKEYFEGDYYH